MAFEKTVFRIFVFLLCVVVTSGVIVFTALTVDIALDSFHICPKGDSP